MNIREVKFFFVFLFVYCLLTEITKGQTAKIYEKELSLKTYPFSDPNPVADISRIYPYFKFHGYTNEGKMQNWKMVVLENDYIQVFVCPAVGGKVWGAIEKSTGKEFIYFNHVVKFRDVAMRGAWTSGGLEYNFGDIGHSPTCATPVDYTTKNNPDGSVSCVVGAEDLPSDTRWNIEIVVYPDKAFFETKVSWYSNNKLPCTYYHWMNAAAKASTNLEFIYPGNKRIGHGGEIGEWPVENGRDLSFYDSNNFGTYKSYHVMNSYSDIFGGYWHNDDFGFGHWSNYDDKPGKKLWIWGLSPEGMIWKDLLTDTDGQYIEFQAGKLFNQAAAGSTATPFKHREFTPFDADIMDEIWFPLKGTKGMVAASKHAALNVEREKGMNHLLLSALQNIDAELKIVSNGEVIRTERVKLKPLELFEIDFVTSNDFTVELGDQLLTYSSKTTDILVDRPIEPNKEFDYTTAYGLYVKALEMEKQRRYNEAMETYEKSIEKEPAFAPSLNRMAMGFFRKGNAEKALEYLRKSLAIDTYDDEANYVYGLVNQKMGRMQEAKSGFSIAAASVKYRSAAYTELATIFLNEKNHPKAREYAQKALGFNAYNLAAHEILAVVARKEGNQEEALAIQQKLAKLDAVNPFGRFEAYLCGQSAEMLAAFKSGITNELPHESYLSLALRYRELGCITEALSVLHEAPQTPEIKLWQADLDQANRISCLQKAAEASPVLVFPFRLETAEMLERMLTINDNWKFRYYLGLTYWNLGWIEKTKEQFIACGNQADYGAFYLAKAKLFDGDKAIVEECLKKARKLEPTDWRAALAEVRFDLDNQKAEDALVLSKEFMKKYPENGEMGMCYAQTLIQLRKYKEAVVFLEAFNVLPYEGATIGRIAYHEACMRAAMDAMAEKKYTVAIKYAEKAKLWPTNLGAGQPYDPDERMDNFMIAYANEKLGKTQDAVKYYSAVSEFKNPVGNEENSKLLLQLLVLRRQGKDKEALNLLNYYVNKYPESQYLKWVKAKFNNSAQSESVEQEIIKASGVIHAYDVAFVDNEFLLMADFTKYIELLK